MFLVERGVRQTMHLGVRFRGSRKGEFNCMLVQQLRGRTFRDFQVAAPLKRCSFHLSMLFQSELSATSKSRPH